MAVACIVYSYDIYLKIMLSIFSFKEDKTGNRSGFEEQGVVVLSAEQGERVLDLAQAEDIAIECEAEEVVENQNDKIFIVSRNSRKMSTLSDSFKIFYFSLCSFKHRVKMLLK